MILPHINKRAKFRAFLVLVLLSFTGQPVYGEERFGELDGITAERHFSGTGNDPEKFTLAPTSMFGPIYSIQRDASGKLFVMEPPAEYWDDLYTDAILAFLAFSVDNNVAEGPLEDFLLKSIGGNDFEKCRVGKIQKTKDGFYALYHKKKDPHEPLLMMLHFTEAPKGARVEKGKGAIIKLLDDTEILIEAKYMGFTPKEYSKVDLERARSVYEIKEFVLRGSPARAVNAFFTSASLQAKNADVFADVCNKLLEAVSSQRDVEGPVKEFLRTVMCSSVDLIGEDELSQSVQLMSAQALTILSWRERGMPGASAMRIVSDPDTMVCNEKHGKSFIDAAKLPDGVTETKKEGAAGFFWRGTEKISKLGPNVSVKLIYDKDRFEADKTKVVMYLMDHGSYAVKGSLSGATDNGRISTTHETFFVNDLLPGSFQVTSTGAGHFQMTKVDLKRVTDGWGIQFNVRYSAGGAIEEVIAQEVKPGDWALALPGYVDYVVNLGGLRFSDLSIDLSVEEASAFLPSLDFSSANLAAIKDAVANGGGTAPYAGLKLGGDAYLLKTVENSPEIKWIPSLKNFSRSISFSDIYSTLSTVHIKGFVKGLQSSYAETLSSPLSVVGVKPFNEEVFSSAKGEPAATLGRAEVLGEYAIKNQDVFKRLSGGPEGDFLIRIPVEYIASVGAQNLRPFLLELSSAPGAYIELFSSGGIGTVSEAVYGEYGINRKSLPETFSPSRENTITIMPVLKMDDVSSRGTKADSWGIGDMRPTDTILSPVGVENDKAGLVRGVVMGLMLNEIARQVNRAGKADEAYVNDALERFRGLCETQGVRDFIVMPIDLVNLASGNINKVVEALNKLIKSMPIIPLNAEEIRIIYERAREAMVRA